VDLLFTDVVLPGGVSGRVLADEALKRRPDLPVLFTTGYTENAIVHHGRLDPNVHLLTKPYTQKDLARKVHELLAKKRK
jgi:CheY-like chemotaxis protein